MTTDAPTDAPDAPDAPDAEAPTEPRRVLHFRWDLDKTYIFTEFDTVRDLVARAFETAEDKRVVPGAATLLRELLARDGDDIERRVTFISGSPRQLRRVLTERLRLDGIEPEQLILKPNLSNLLLFRFKAIRSQVGYKLEALLRSRIYGDQVEEVLFGDDAEQDALVYSLYGDLLNGRVERDGLAAVLAATNTSRRESDRVLALYDHLTPGDDPVRRVFIHLERRSPTERFDVFGSRVVPVFNWFQAAMVLHADGMLAPSSLVRVIEAMGRRGYTAARLTNSVQDLVRRGFVGAAGIDALADVVARANEILGHRPSTFVGAFRDALAGLGTPSERMPWIEQVDYMAACRGLGKYHRPRLAIPGARILFD